MVAKQGNRNALTQPILSHRAGLGAGALRVLIVDDHTMFRRTLHLLLETYAELHVVGEAADGQSAVQEVERLKPDVVLMDIAMPGLNGIEATSLIKKRWPAVKVLVLSGYDYGDRVAAALDAGAQGYILKNSTPDELRAAIIAVGRCETYLPESLRGHFLQGPTGSPRRVGSPLPLSAREREIVQLIAEGYSQVAIAQRLYISVKTVETHKENIARKLGIRGTAGLIHYAIRKGFIFIDRDEYERPTDMQAAV